MNKKMRTKKNPTSPARNKTIVVRSNVTLSPGVKNGSRKITIVVGKLQDYSILMHFGMTDDDHANPYVKNITDLILNEHQSVKPLAINVTGNLIKEGTNEHIETVGKDGNPYKIFSMVKIFDAEQSDTQLKAFGEKGC